MAAVGGRHLEHDAAMLFQQGGEAGLRGIHGVGGGDHGLESVEKMLT